MKPRIFYPKPSITDLEVSYATDAAANGWGDQCYAYISRFEELFKQHLGVSYAIATSSCTGALHMGMAVGHLTLHWVLQETRETTCGCQLLWDALLPGDFIVSCWACLFQCT